MISKIRAMVIAELDHLFDTLSDYNFKELSDNEEDVSQEEADDIESIFMSYRNVIAGTDWDGQQREYEKYKVRK